MWPGGWSRTRAVSWKHGFSSLLSLCTAECSWQLICSSSFRFLIHKMIRWHLSSSSPTHQKYFARVEQLPFIIYQNIEEKEAAKSNQYIRSSAGEESEEILFKMKMSIFTYDRQLGSNSWKPVPWAKLGQYNWVPTE